MTGRGLQSLEHKGLVVFLKRITETTFFRIKVFFDFRPRLLLLTSPSVLTVDIHTLEDNHCCCRQDKNTTITYMNQLSKGKHTQTVVCVLLSSYIIHI